MKTLLKQYYETKLTKYRKIMMNERNAEIAAKYALDDMAVTVKRNREIYSEDEAMTLLSQEIEDARMAI